MFQRANPMGWVQGDKLTPLQINAIDVHQSRAIDGSGGGAYAPLAVIDVQGAGMDIHPLSGTVTLGKLLTIGAGGSFVTAPTANVLLGGKIVFQGLADLLSGATLRIEKGATLDVLGQADLESGATFAAKSGSVVDLRQGSTSFVRPGATVRVEGQLFNPGQIRIGDNGGLVVEANGFLAALANSFASFAGTAAIASGGTLSVQTGGAMVVESGATATVKSGAKAVVEAGAQLDINTTLARIGADAKLTVNGTPGHAATVAWGASSVTQFDAGSTITGSPTLGAGATLTTHATAKIANAAAVTQSGPTTFAGASGYRVPRLVVLNPAADLIVAVPYAADIYVVDTDHMTVDRSYTFGLPSPHPEPVLIHVYRPSGSAKATLRNHNGVALVTFSNNSLKPVSVTLILLNGHWNLFGYSGIFTQTGLASEVHPLPQ